jgi:hypothetical protein
MSGAGIAIRHGCGLPFRYGCSGKIRELASAGGARGPRRNAMRIRWQVQGTGTGWADPVKARGGSRVGNPRLPIMLQPPGLLPARGFGLSFE